MSANRVAKGKDPASEFDIDDHLAVLGARVAPLASDFQALMSASLKASRALYPDQPEVDSQEDLEGLLKGAKERLQLWRSSSARAGADAALAFVMSWHEDIELEKIETLPNDPSSVSYHSLVLRVSERKILGRLRKHACS